MELVNTLNLRDGKRKKSKFRSRNLEFESVHLQKCSHLWVLNGIRGCLHQFGIGLNVLTVVLDQVSGPAALFILLICDLLYHDVTPLFQDGRHTIKLLTQYLFLVFAVLLLGIAFILTAQSCSLHWKKEWFEDLIKYRNDFCKMWMVWLNSPEVQTSIFLQISSRSFMQAWMRSLVATRDPSSSLSSVYKMKTGNTSFISNFHEGLEDIHAF